MRALIKNGSVVTAADTAAADVWIEDGKILAVVQHGKGDFGKADTEIDAKGKYVIPGGIDVHTHLDMPFGGTVTIDDFESGTIAAAHGGTTSIVDFAIQAKGEALRQGLDTWHGKAEGKAAVDYGFHMIMTDTSPEVLEEMKTVVDEGVTSFKLFMAYPGVLYLDDKSIFRAMLRAGELGGLIQFHAEAGLPLDVLVEKALADGKTDPIHHVLTRPEVSEATGTERAMALAEMADVPVYIVHLTCRRALEAVRNARVRGIKAFAETCPQYLYKSQDDARGTEGHPFDGAKYVCSPPVRPKEHQEVLWRGLATDDLQIVATDHCSFNMSRQKELGRESFAKIPNGMPGTETRMLLMYQGVVDGKISLNRFVDVTATQPAKLFGLYPRKGSVQVGADADVVVWDPNRPKSLDQKEMHLRCDYSAYEGMTVAGSPTHVFSRGELIVENDEFLGKAGRGQFLRRSPVST
ncbi:MAG: dihydropyrimidinase [Myxococcota bacterium]